MGNLKSAVYFANVRARSDKENKITKVRNLFDAAGMANIAAKGNLVAIKVHFGELRTDAYINPILVRHVVDKVHSLQARPFVTDTNTLYLGGRANSVDHSITATTHGFGYSVLNAPIIIADGLKGQNFSSVEINKKHFRSVKIAGDIASADSLIVLSHFNGHFLSGFGGAIKNLRMGCVPPAGKTEQHSSRPIFNQDLCQGCGQCAQICPNFAITIETKIAGIDYNACPKAAGECLRVCPAHALDFD